MIKLALFLLVSAGLLIFSMPSFRVRASHGTYRFFAFECVLLLLMMNVEAWFSDPLGFAQIISWILLTIAIVLVVAGFGRLQRIGKPSTGVDVPGNVRFENTSVLVTDGLYRLIRHPMYSSLLFLGWGIFFKDPGSMGLMISGVMSAFLFATARAEETENLRRFGSGYEEYMKRSKMFIPFLW